MTNSEKVTPSSDWFSPPHLEPYVKPLLEWLQALGPAVERIANFGCHGGDEALALLWLLDAAEIAVVEREKWRVDIFKERLDKHIAPHYPEKLQGRPITTLVEDMSKGTSLASDYYELAFCQNVLYYMEHELHTVRSAIREMARITKPNGWVIAVEHQFRAKYEEDALNGGYDSNPDSVPVPVNTSEAQDISRLFEQAGLTRVDIPSAPPHSYCYQKP